MATAVDLEALSLDELEAELATLASHLYAGTCRWLELVGELDRRGGLGRDRMWFVRRVAGVAVCVDAARGP